MSDAADIAGEEQARIEEERAARFAREQAKRESQTGSDYCRECGYEIPAPRREALPWVTRCVPCQDFVDRWNDRYR